MLKLLTGFSKDKVDVDSRMTLLAAIYLGVVGPGIFIVQPAFVQGLVELLGFTEREAGYVASAEMWGIAGTTVALTFIAKRLNWRAVLLGAVLLAAVGNLLSTMTQQPISFAVLRAITGIGSGALISLTFTIIGITSNPDRNFGLLIMWVLVYGAVGFLLLPVGYSTVGMTGVLVFFAMFNLSALPLVRFLPVSGKEHGQYAESPNLLPPLFNGLAVATLFVYFLAQGVVWAYLFLMGVEGGATEQQVSNGLTISQFFGIAGALTAATVATRFGRILPLFIGVVGSFLSLVMLFGEIGAVIYATAVCLFNYAWNMTHPFMLAALASFDKTGRLVVYGVAAQMLGLAFGPALAASVISANDFSNVIWLGMVLFVLSLFCIIPPLLKHQRQTVLG